MLSALQVNEVARLLLIARNRGPDFLYDPACADNLLWPGFLTQVDRQVLDVVRRAVESGGHREPVDGVDASEVLTETGENGLCSQSLASKPEECL